MNRLGAGLIAGVGATAVLSGLMLAKSAMGLLPELDVIAMISQMTGLGMGAAWGLHFAIGAVWGILFALVAPMVPGSGCWLRGAIFSAAPWLAMMLLMMPMAGAGLLGLSLGIAAPLMTLMLHLVFGAVMGAAYGILARQHDWVGGEVTRPR